MLRLTASNLPKLLGATALSLTLMLAACGQASTSDTAAPEAEETTTEEAVVEDASAEDGADAADDASADEVTLSDELVEEQESMMRALRAYEDAEEDAEDLKSYPKADDEDLEMDVTDTVSRGTGDQDKAPNGHVLLVNGGMEVTVPTSWAITQEGSDAFSLVSPDRQVVGFMTARRKESGHTYDIVAMISYAPKNLVEQGYTDVKVVAYDTLRSSKGTLCDAYVQVMASKNGRQYVRYYEYLQSKNYINALAFSSDISGWAANANEIEEMVNTVSFVMSEVI